MLGLLQQTLLLVHRGRTSCIDDAQIGTLETRNHLKTRLNTLQLFEGRGELIDGFEDETQWNGTFTVETGTVYQGSQSFKITANNNFYQDFTSLDLSNKTISLMVQTNSNDGWGMNIRDNSGNRHALRVKYADDRYPNDWLRVNFCPSSDLESVVVDFTDINRININAKASTEAYIDSLRAYEGPLNDGQGRVMFQFDDGETDVYNEFYPLLDERGMAASTAVIPDATESGQKMQPAELDELYSKGWGILNHTWDTNNLWERSGSEQRADIEKGKRWLIENVYRGAEDLLVYLGSGFNDDTLDIAAEYATMAFGTGTASTGWTMPTPTNPLAIDRVDSLQPADAERLDHIANYGGLGILMYHTTADISTADFQTILDEIESRDLKVVTPSQFRDQLIPIC